MITIVNLTKGQLDTLKAVVTQCRKGHTIALDMIDRMGIGRSTFYASVNQLVGMGLLVRVRLLDGLPISDSEWDNALHSNTVVHIGPTHDFDFWRNA